MATAPTATTTTRAARLASRMDRDARTRRPPRFVILHTVHAVLAGVVSARLTLTASAACRPPATGEAQAHFDVTIEIPKGQRNKYEMDHHTHRIRLDRMAGDPALL